MQCKKPQQLGLFTSDSWPDSNKSNAWAHSPRGRQHRAFALEHRCSKCHSLDAQGNHGARIVLCRCQRAGFTKVIAQEAAHSSNGLNNSHGYSVTNECACGHCQRDETRATAVHSRPFRLRRCGYSGSPSHNGKLGTLEVLRHGRRARPVVCVPAALDSSRGSHSRLQASRARPRLARGMLQGATPALAPHARCMLCRVRLEWRKQKSHPKVASARTRGLTYEQRLHLLVQLQPLRCNLRLLPLALQHQL